MTPPSSPQTTPLPRQNLTENLNIKQQTDYGVILLTEYHASSIRLRRVLLLRSDIRLSPSASLAAGELFASQVLRRIEYHCDAKPNNITARRAISLFAQQRISLTYKAEKRELHGNLFLRYSLFCFYRQFRICLTNTLGYAHTLISFLR